MVSFENCLYRFVSTPGMMKSHRWTVRVVGYKGQPPLPHVFIQPLLLRLGAVPDDAAHRYISDSFVWQRLMCIQVVVLVVRGSFETRRCAPAGKKRGTGNRFLAVSGVLRCAGAFKKETLPRRYTGFVFRGRCAPLVVSCTR